MLHKVKHKGIALLVLAAAQFMVVLDATITNVALPAIRDSLKFASQADLQWVITVYALTFGGFLLLGGRLADLFGRRRLFLAGTILFATASLVAGFAQDPTQMIVLRGVQGLGGALLSPAALSLVLTIFRETKERNRALGVWSMVAAGGGAVGLVLGGLLTQYVDWRWIFFINVPIAILVAIMTFRFVPGGKPEKTESVDILGAFTITGSLIAVVFALAKAAQNGWGDSSTIISFVVSAVLMAAFIFNELRVKHPLINLAAFRRRNVTGGALVMLLMPAAMFGFFFYMSIYLQQILGYTPTETGVANLPFTATIMVVAGVLSRFATKVNSKVVLTIAPLLAAAGLLFFARIPVHATYLTDILPGIILMSSGMAMVFVTATIAATSGISHKESGFVSGLLNTSQQIGGAIGLAVLTVISTAATKAQLADLHALPTQDVVNEALVHGFHQGFIAAAFFAVAASGVALLVFKTRKMSADEQADELTNEAEALAAIPGA
ncbi:MAG: transporter [Candidatus Saccharibacteria bacterium]|nr:transporter [Candidatus Saccharibacteria bacterium]